MTVTNATLDPVVTGSAAGMMNALVYGGPGQRAWQPKPRPVIREPGDAIVRITTSTICGTDLHIMKAYDTFANAANERALKVILTN